jgi:hypothetical protein
VIVSLCDFARAHCPDFPEGTGRVHWPVFDPIVVRGNEDFRLAAFRGVRDEIRARIEAALETGELDSPPEAFGPSTKPSGMGRLLSGLGGLFGRDRESRQRSGPEDE